jgi:hypothetical protein
MRALMFRRRMMRHPLRAMPARLLLLLLLSLIQPLLALLLLAGVPSAELMRGQDGKLVRVIEAGSKTLWLHRERSAASSSVEAKAGPDRLDGDDKTPDPVVGAPDLLAFGLDRAAVSGISCVWVGRLILFRPWLV